MFTRKKIGEMREGESGKRNVLLIFLLLFFVVAVESHISMIKRILAHEIKTMNDSITIKEVFPRFNLVP